jgi:hypothetical protein
MAENPAQPIPIIMHRLRRAIDDLYAAFAAYGPPTSLHGSPYRDVEAILADITCAPLRELDAESLSCFASAAMTTVGEVDIYKHFLPRILEHALSEHGHLGFDPEIIAGKLLYAEWSDWPEMEKHAVAEFLELAWARARGQHPDEEDASGWLCAIALLDLDVEGSLDGWLMDMTTDVALQLAWFLSMDAEDIAKGDGYWEEVTVANRKLVGDWLCSDALQSALLSVIDAVAEMDQWRLDMIDEHIAIFQQADWR